MTKNPCERKCWTCGNVAMHADDVAPDVCCAKCGSQDTRRTKPSARDQAMADREEQARVGALLARCSFVQMTDGHSPRRWLVTVDVNGKRGHAYDNTQLEAIRNAVEAAEQGVRE